MRSLSSSFKALCCCVTIAFACSNPSAPDSQASIEFVEDVGSFLIFNDTPDAVVEMGVTRENPDFGFFSAVEEGFLQAHPDDSPYIFVLVNFPNADCCTYRPMANTVRGIGWAHRGQTEPAEFDPEDAIFDRTPNSRIEGFISMGFWETYFFPNSQVVNERLVSLVVGHELAHAWLAFPWYRGAGVEVKTDMLGIEGAHWSFYLDSGSSPMEGLDWRDNGNGTFTTDAKISNNYEYRFNNFELYLMGLVDANEVPPWFVIDNPQNCQIDGRRVACPDAATRSFGWGQSVTISGTRREIRVEDVIATEGVRSPATSQVSGDIDVAFVLIKRPTDELSVAQKVQVSQLIERAIQNWPEMTHGQSGLINRSSFTPR